MNFFNPDYAFFYKIYKKIPAISAIAVAVSVFVFSIVDVSSYYIICTDFVILDLLIWWSIGAIAAFATWFISAMTVSATILRTDAMIEIESSNKTDN